MNNFNDCLLPVVVHLGRVDIVTIGNTVSQGGDSNYFLTGCAAPGLKPLPISKDFSPSKNG